MKTNETEIRRNKRIDGWFTLINAMSLSNDLLESYSLLKDYWVIIRLTACVSRFRFAVPMIIFLCIKSYKNNGIIGIKIRIY